MQPWLPCTCTYYVVLYTVLFLGFCKIMVGFLHVQSAHEKCRLCPCPLIQQSSLSPPLPLQESKMKAWWPTVRIMANIYNPPTFLCGMVHGIAHNLCTISQTFKFPPQLGFNWKMHKLWHTSFTVVGAHRFIWIHKPMAIGTIIMYTWLEVIKMLLEKLLQLVEWSGRFCLLWKMYV